MGRNTRRVFLHVHLACLIVDGGPGAYSHSKGVSYYE